MIKITARNFKLTNGLRDAIISKFNKFEQTLSQGEFIDVVLETKSYGQKIEVFFKINNRLIKAESIEDDLYVAIDLVVDRLQSQISKYSGKLADNSKESIRFAEFDSDYKDEDKDSKPKIVRRKHITNKPMMEEEAILQMELLGHNSFMFFNDDTGTTSMLYKRNDGDYGILIKE